MAQNLGQSQQVQLGQTLRVDPKIILRAKLIQLNQFELEQMIESELVTNPALERFDSQETPTDEEVLSIIAPQESATSGDWWEAQRGLPHDSITSWVELAASERSLENLLYAVLLPKLPRHLLKLGEWIIASIDERGYLDCLPEEAALACDCSLEDVENTIRLLQDVAPPGIGSRNLQECLINQVQKGTIPLECLCLKILTDHWEDFVSGRLKRIGRALKVSPENVGKAVTFIGTLSPYPAQAFQEESSSHTNVRIAAVTPDIIIERTFTGWTAIVNGVSHHDLGIDSFYRTKFSEYKNKTEKTLRPVDPNEKQHVLHQVRSAEEFIEGVRNRTQLLQQIAQILIKKQAGFLSTGSYDFIEPLTRSQLAKDLNAHESTISRATSGKFVRLPSGGVVSFDVFFKPALRVQKMIEEILQAEDPNRPISDLEISKRLSERGVDVARRTVHKYRDRSRSLSSHKRKIA